MRGASSLVELMRQFGQPAQLPEPTLRPVLDLNDPGAAAQWLADNGHRFDYHPEMYS